MSNKVFIGNIHYDVTDTDLNRLFSDYGDVVSVTLKRDIKSIDGKDIKRSFAFIEFESDADIKRALRLDGYSLKGRNIFVKPFDEKKNERPKGYGPVKTMQDKKPTTTHYEIKCVKCGEIHAHACKLEESEA